MTTGRRAAEVGRTSRRPRAGRGRKRQGHGGRAAPPARRISQLVLAASNRTGPGDPSLSTSIFVRGTSRSNGRRDADDDDARCSHDALHHPLPLGRVHGRSDLATGHAVIPAPRCNDDDGDGDSSSTRRTARWR